MLGVPVLEGGAPISSAALRSVPLAPKHNAQLHLMLETLLGAQAFADAGRPLALLLRNFYAQPRVLFQCCAEVLRQSLCVTVEHEALSARHADDQLRRTPLLRLVAEYQAPSGGREELALRVPETDIGCPR